MEVGLAVLTVILAALGHVQRWLRMRPTLLVSQPIFASSSFFLTPLQMQNGRSNTSLSINEEAYVQFTFTSSIDTTRIVTAPHYSPLLPSAVFLLLVQYFVLRGPDRNPHTSFATNLRNTSFKLYNAS